jgi:hypothetical protein
MTTTKRVLPVKWPADAFSGREYNISTLVVSEDDTTLHRGCLVPEERTWEVVLGEHSFEVDQDFGCGTVFRSDVRGTLLFHGTIVGGRNPRLTTIEMGLKRGWSMRGQYLVIRGPVGYVATLGTGRLITSAVLPELEMTEQLYFVDQGSHLTCIYAGKENVLVPEERGFRLE